MSDDLYQDELKGTERRCGKCGKIVDAKDDPSDAQFIDEYGHCLACDKVFGHSKEVDI